MNDPNRSESQRFSELHLELQDWLAGYVDGELDDHHTAVVEAHLAGCGPCRADVARQQIMSQRLAHTPVTRMPVELHQRLDAALAGAADQPARRSPAEGTPNVGQWLARLCNPVLAGATGWAVALALTAVLLWPGSTITDPGAIPMVSEVLQDYQQTAMHDLPALVDSTGIKLPATLSDARLLATWSTTIGGEQAQAFAMRRGNDVIVQYRISENVLFRNPDVRQAMAKNGDYQAHQAQLGVLAIPMKNAGLLVVGPSRALPTRSELTLASS